MATWNELQFSYGSQLNTIKMGQLMENFASFAEGSSGSPKLTTSSLTANVIKRSQLVTSTSSGSKTGSAGTNDSYVLTGGMYSWWTISGTSTISNLSGFGGGSDLAAGTIGLGFSIGGGSTIYIDERYVQSSPPYNLGDGDIQLFIFVMLDKSGGIVGTQISQDPPWANNGPTNIAPEKYEGPRGYRCYKRLGFNGPYLHDVTWHKDNHWIDKYMRGEVELVDDWVEITQKIKNRDAEIVPHPFGNVQDGCTVVMIDSFSTNLCERLRLVQENLGAREVRLLLQNGEIIVDNERTKMKAPSSVMPVRARLKLTRA